MSPEKQNRSTDAAVLVRMTKDQRARLERALAKVARPGLKPALSRFLLETALAEADRILGSKG